MLPQRGLGSSGGAVGVVKEGLPDNFRQRCVKDLRGSGAQDGAATGRQNNREPSLNKVRANKDGAAL